MRRSCCAAVLALASLAPTAAVADTTYYSTHRHRIHHHHRHPIRDTFRRVGIGAAGGASIGAIAGGGPGAAIGAIAGAAVGAVYDGHKKTNGQ